MISIRSTPLLDIALLCEAPRLRDTIKDWLWRHAPRPRPTVDPHPWIDKNPPEPRAEIETDAWGFAIHNGTPTLPITERLLSGVQMAGGLWVIDASTGPVPEETALLRAARAVLPRAPLLYLWGCEEVEDEDWLHLVEQNAREQLTAATFSANEAIVLRGYDAAAGAQAIFSRLPEVSQVPNRAEQEPFLLRILDSAEPDPPPNAPPNLRRLRGVLERGTLKKNTPAELIGGNCADPLVIKESKPVGRSMDFAFPGFTLWASVLLPWWAAPREGSALVAPGSLRARTQARLLAYLLPRERSGRPSLRSNMRLELKTAGGAYLACRLREGSPWLYEGLREPLEVQVEFPGEVALPRGAAVALYEERQRIACAVVLD